MPCPCFNMLTEGCVFPHLKGYQTTTYNQVTGMCMKGGAGRGGGGGRAHVSHVHDHRVDMPCC